MVHHPRWRSCLSCPGPSPPERPQWMTQGAFASPPRTLLPGSLRLPSPPSCGGSSQKGASSAPPPPPPPPALPPPSTTTNPASTATVGSWPLRARSAVRPPSSTLLHLAAMRWLTGPWRGEVDGGWPDPGSQALDLASAQPPCPPSSHRGGGFRQWLGRMVAGQIWTLRTRV